VLDAFEEAIVRHGVQGASFARIATLGGFHRSLVQHHFRTREQLVEACLERLVERYVDYLERVAEGGPEALLDWLLSPHGPAGPPRIAQVADAYAALANADAGAAARLGDMYERFIAALSEALGDRRELAFLLVCVAFGRAGLEVLGIPEAATGVARETARRWTG